LAIGGSGLCTQELLSAGESQHLNGLIRDGSPFFDQRQQVSAASRRSKLASQRSTMKRAQTLKLDSLDGREIFHE
jgi:hypothetical protein